MVHQKILRGGGGMKKLVLIVRVTNLKCQLVNLKEGVGAGSPLPPSP